MRNMIGILSLVLFLTGCFNLPVQSSGKVSVLNTEARTAVAKAVSEAKAVSTFDPNSKVETTIQPPSGALSGSKITLPIGALGIAVDLVVEESVPMSETSVASSLNIRSDIAIVPVGAGLIIRPTQNVDLTKPLTIAMAVGALTSLRTWLADEHYAVFYKSMIGGELRAGVIPSSSLRFNAEGKIEFEGYFGAFWLCRVSSPIEERIEVHTDEPTVNANHVSVIASTGIVSEETIAAKASVPEVSWSAVSLVYDSDARKGNLSASIGSGRTLNSCQVDLRDSISASSGTNDSVASDLAYSFLITKKTAHSLVGRFRCLDDQGRLAISPWSASILVPALADPPVATSISINNAAPITNASTVNLALAATSATEMYITDKSDCTVGGTWEIYSTSRTWKLTRSNDVIGIYVKFRNQQGLESSCIGASIVHDTIAPTSLVLMINGGVAATSSTAVSLSLQANSAVQMYITNTTGCSSGGSWEAWNTSRTWTLTQSNGTNSIYAKFKDLAGNESSCISASIVYDTIAPTANSVVINSGATTTTSMTVTLQLGSMGASEMYVTQIAGCSTGGNWETYGSSKSWNIAQSSGTGAVYAKFRDQAGNESACVNDTINVSIVATTLTTMQVGGGSDHTCALLKNGQVKCWGSNGYGQLGQGHNSTIGDGPNEMGSQLPPINLGTNRKATAIAVGQLHSCALLDNGTVKCWGYGANGQIGQGNNVNMGDNPNEMGDALPPIDLGTSRTALAISSLYHHTCALLDNHSVKCWGIGSWGNLGYGSAMDIGNQSNQMGDALPSVDLGTGRSAKSVATGLHHTCALLDNNSVKCWGYNADGQLGQGHTNQLGDSPNEMGDTLPAVPLGTGRTAKSIATGHVHSCAVLDNNSVKCWGSNYHGELGQGNNLRYGDEPNELGDNLPAIALGTGRSAKSVTTSIQQTCALLDNGQVKCWGYNALGELGMGHTNDWGPNASDMGDALPMVNLGTGHSALAIGTGWYHVCAILENELIKCWGNNGSAQLGLGNTVTMGDNANEMGDALPTVDLSSDISTTGLSLWLRADQGLFQDTARSTMATAMNDPIAVWADRSGQSGDMSVSSSLDPSAARPLLNTNGLNGHPVVSFTGVSNLQNLVNYAYPNTIFILARYSTNAENGRVLSGSSNNWLLGWYNGDANAYFTEGWIAGPSGSAAGNTWEVYVGEQSSNSQRLFHNSQLIAATNYGGTQGPNGLSLGGWSSCCGEFAASEVAELIVYNRVLSDAERTSVLSYLSQRYAL